MIHARRSVCECGHAFTLKREGRITASSPVKTGTLHLVLRIVLHYIIINTVYIASYILHVFINTD